MGNMVESNQNYFMGEEPDLKNSKIKFIGRNIILFCENDVTLVNSNIVFNGNNSLIYLSSDIKRFNDWVGVYHRRDEYSIRKYNTFK